MTIPEKLVSTPLKQKAHRRRGQGSALPFLFPALLTMSILSIAPIAYTIYISFTNFDAMHFLSYQFVGLQNFQQMFTAGSPLESIFLPTIVWTTVFAFVTTLLNYFVGLVLAVLLSNRHMHEAAVYRSLLVVPWAIPSLISILAWQGLLNHSYGQINAMLHAMGLARIAWLSNPFWARVAIIMVNLWAGFPYMMTVSLGALQAIPREMYESAEIDGASRMQQFKYLTMPQIWKLSLPLVIPSFAFNFNNFNAVYLLTAGGPPRPSNPFAGYTDILASAAYKMTLQFNKYDWAASISVILFIIVGILSFLQMHYTRAFEEVD